MSQKRNNNLDNEELKSGEFEENVASEVDNLEEFCEVCEQKEEQNQKEDKSQEYLLLAQQIQAEFDNFRKRNEKSIIMAEERGEFKAIEKILPLLDSFYNAKKQNLPKETIDALNTLQNQFMLVLGDMGVKKIEALGKPFDPNLHNAVMIGQDADREEDEVLEEFQEGFIFKDKVLRHSMVKVNKWL